MLPALFEEVLHVLDDFEGLEDCGRPAVILLKRCIRAVRDEQTTALHLSCYLRQLSDERILSYSYKDVPTCWRRLYTDASLLEAISRCSYDRVEKVEALKAIERLDLALVVAGAPGPNRSRLVHALIAFMQERYLPLTSWRTPKSKRRKTDCERVEAPPITRPVLRLSSAPSLDEYPRQYLETPFIVTGGASSWPALNERSWSSPSYLERLAGPGRVVPVEVGGTYTMATWSQRIISFSHFLASIGLADPLERGDDELFYLAQHDLFRQLPKLQDDILLPDYVYSAPSAPSHAPDYAPPDTESGCILNAWLGPAGTNSPPHTDPYFNCFVQVVGAKWIWLAPPSCSSAMYPFESEDGGSTSYMSNTSQIDPSMPVSSERFPRFVAEVEPKAMQAVLEPGDMLVMPPGWWHSLKSLSVSFSVSMWY